MNLLYNPFLWTTDKSAVQDLRIITYASNIALICFACVLFVNWKSGPEWWVKIGPKVYWGWALIAYVIVPLINILLFTIFLAAPKSGVNPKKDLYFCWKVVYNSYCIGYLI